VSATGLQVGDTETSPNRTITEADVIGFAGLSGDFNPLHIDAQHAAKTPYGRRIAHGLLGTSVAAGLFTWTDMSRSLQSSLIAMLGVEARYLAPLFPGDTVSVTATVKDVRETSKADRVVITIERALINQDGTRVQEIVTPLLVRR
jgi:3-hydroxybutyryl-CoA dehydratase